VGRRIERLEAWKMQDDALFNLCHGCPWILVERC